MTFTWSGIGEKAVAQLIVLLLLAVLGQVASSVVLSVKFGGVTDELREMKGEIREIRMMWADHLKDHGNGAK